ncbi:nucleotidyltransferase [Bacillus canaveralius]|uniref:tRNA(Met) cytidine acetate ligase n=1 Tax=Bacillus canaveralius TaxID=1403243 RepID=A0A2N5GNS5_9BACI|nr:nucleotidyltransferase [Bacillus canaveralius]PLR84099.1 nucleotidyltransferase [Bacillus canaveralius]PLR96255.1 nucleotidyltransferase [Bacillus canaveralius]
MKVVGVIVEYNPFHNGHAYHLDMAKKVTGADVAIAAMSGNFLQRGEPALVSKWTRAKMALLGGVDLVFELPYQFATQKAEVFANGAVSILSSAGCTHLCFGSESGDIDSFYTAIDFLNMHDSEFQKNIRYYLSKGVSYPKALALAFQDVKPGEEMADLSKPNNILGFQYIKSLQRLETSIEAVTVKRKSAEHHDEHFSSATIASATSIRKALFSEQGKLDEVQSLVPESTYRLLVEHFQEFGRFHSWDSYWPYLRYRLITMSPAELAQVYEVEEGLENRLISCALQAASFADFMQMVKTKRYTWTRLQRTCVHILTNTKKAEMKTVTEPNYLRLLGMSERGRDYLRNRKQHFTVPVVSRLSAFKNEQIELDIKSSRVYALGVQPDRHASGIGDEFKQHPIYLPDEK